MCRSLRVIKKGTCISASPASKVSNPLSQIIDPVILINEATVLDGGQNPVTAIASQKSITWHISQIRFQRLMEKYPILRKSLFNVLARCNRWLISNYEDLIARPVKARTAKLLLNLSSYGSQPVDRICYSNQYLAACISTVPEAVSRSIKILRETGVIECKLTQITVKYTDKLAELV